MSDNSKIASESMKILTEKVLRADLGSRKRKMIHFKSITYASLVWVPCLIYGVYVNNQIICSLQFTRKVYLCKLIDRLENLTIFGRPSLEIITSQQDNYSDQVRKI